MPKDHDDPSSQTSSPTLPPPPPPPHTHIPARLSLDFHRDSDATGGGGSAFDMSSILSMVQRLDSRDGAGSAHSYEMVSGEADDDARYFGRGGNEGAGIGNSGVLVDRSTPTSPLIVTNHWKGDLGTQLDGGTDRHWEHVSVGDSAGAAGETRQERRDNAGMEGQKPDLSGGAPRSHSSSNDHHQDYREEDIHPALRPGHQEGSYLAGGDFFRDFDGVHYTPEGATPPPLSVTAPPHANHFNPEHSSHLHNSQLRPQQELRPTSYASAGTSISESSRDSGFVYYPAPVPAVLNLPPLMAKDGKARNRLTKVQKRASQQVLSDVAAGDDKSGNRRSVFLGESNDARTSPGTAEPDPAPPRKLDEQRLSKLPPALRASAFFDSMQSAGAHSVAPELKESSAVATLDSILDASANAPAAAFTDHPMTGTSSTSHLPMRNEYRNSVAMTVMLHPGESPRSSVDGGGSGEAQQQQQLRNSHSFEVSTNNDTPPLGPGGETLPTTLLAELESRKQQQKSRTRTAASAFPSGIRSTLLELDAVAQVQARSRRQKRPHLAWEEPEEEGAEDDEDVPLGLLYHQGHVSRGMHRGGRDEDVPLGLLMQKEMEDAEPLSRRRERLRQQNGHSATSPPQIPQIPVLEVEDEVEEETLAQRMKRLKDTKTKEKRQSKFGDGSLELSFTPAAGSSTATPPPEEETLAQRRKRLRDEEERRKLSVEAKAVQAEVRKRASMATILHGQHGGGIGLGGGMMGRSTPMLRPNTGGGGGGGGGGGLVHQIGGSMLRPQMSMGNMHVGGNRGMGMGAMNGMMMPGMPGGMTYGAMAMGGTAGGGVAPLTPQEIAMNNKQREMVERWRDSVL
ncbi:hypothetical protein K440DRAFT_149880 [Wilcoxina mikolae CBS 423.85]|nr:hypothetical protein K440DRAFT_149880 [Wilcoxina mikolae CBS 423.85]